MPAELGLDSRAIAVQGIGFSSRLVGLQGFWIEDVIPPEPQPILPAAHRSMRRDTDDDVLLFIL